MSVAFALMSFIGKCTNSSCLRSLAYGINLSLPYSSFKQMNLVTPNFLSVSTRSSVGYPPTVILLGTMMFESIVGPVKFLSMFLPKLTIDLLIQSLDALMSRSGNVDTGTIGTIGSNDARIAELKMNIVSRLLVGSKNIILFCFVLFCCLLNYYFYFICLKFFVSFVGMRKKGINFQRKPRFPLEPSSSFRTLIYYLVWDFKKNV